MLKSNFSLKKYKNLLKLNYLLSSIYIKNRFKKGLNLGKFKVFLVKLFKINNINKILVLYKSILKAFKLLIPVFIGKQDLEALRIDLFKSFEIKDV